VSLANAPRLRLRLSSSPPGGQAGTVVVTHLADFDHLANWPQSGIASVDITLPGASSDDPTWTSLERVASALSPLPPGQPWDDLLLLEILNPDLAGHPWEELGPALSRRVIRYSPRPAAHAYEPIELPLSILLADDEADDEREAVVTRFFRTVRNAQQSAVALLELVAAGQFDIVHLAGWTVSGEGDTERVTYSDGSPIEERRLRRALLQSRTRLLVLEVGSSCPPGGESSLDSLRGLAHRLHSASGVSVIAAPAADFSAFYLDLTHDVPLSKLVTSIVPKAPADRPAIWLRQGADFALRLLGRSARIAADVVREQRRLSAAHEAQEELRRARGVDRFGGITASALDSIGHLRELTYSFDRETHGYIPMTKTDNELRSVRQTRAQEIPEPGRVVNTWLQTGDRALPNSMSLASGAAYELVVGIGSHDPRSATTDPTTLDESSITDYDQSGLATLEVVVSSTDFSVDEPRQRLRLPPAPGDSELVSFQVQAPVESGVHHLRVGIYHRTNLIQSLIMTALVTQEEEPSHSPGYWAQLEWALSSSLKNLEDLEQPAVSILTNEGPGGTHTFVLVGTAANSDPEIHKQIDLPPDQLKTLVDDVRGDFQSICSTLRNGRLERYRFDRDNRGSRGQFLEDLCVLALAGSGLFVQLTTGSDASFNEQLETRLRGSRLIQIASVRSANYAFPWGLVYDHEFRAGRLTTLCDTVGRVLDAGGSVEQLVGTPCFADECPERHNPRVVCPSGFWGFRHVLEQPLLTLPAMDHPDGDDAEDVRGTPRHDVVTSIPLAGAATPEVVIGLSEALSDWSPHAKAARELLGGYAAVHSSIDELLSSLQRLDLHLAYFYCHGGRKRSKPFLGLGTSREEEALFPQYLKPLAWPARHPFVFINGCQTVGITPDDLLTFNRMFARAEASGVLGTEISIPERLAQSVAIEFFEGFRRRESVGEIVRRIRLGLLARRNPLGLAYTPYCMASLRLTA